MNTGLIFFRIKGYLKYLALSINSKGHGIHSPFVFDLVNRVFRNYPDRGIVYKIENVRKRLIKDQGTIEVTDLGTGSGGSVMQQKKVSRIARSSAVPEKYGIFLYGMAREFGRPLIAELGTSFGISTMYMASACPGSEVISIEGSQETGIIASENFKKTGLANIRLLTGSFEENLPEIFQGSLSPGLVFIDGNHRKAPLLNYFGRIAELSDLNTVVIIDDINFSPEMNAAWREIREHPRVTLTIDIYRMGIVFFRTGIVRKNYIIRY